jgi:hypothetical protein
VYRNTEERTNKKGAASPFQSSKIKGREAAKICETSQPDPKIKFDRDLMQLYMQLSEMVQREKSKDL